MHLAGAKLLNLNIILIYKKKDNDEPREVSAIACNDGISDGEGIRVNDFLPEAIRTDTVSKYELRFFRSVYNIMPTQLAKLSAPSYDDLTDEFSMRYFYIVFIYHCIL